MGPGFEHIISSVSVNHQVNGLDGHLCQQTKRTTSRWDMPFELGIRVVPFSFFGQL